MADAGSDKENELLPGTGVLNPGAAKKSEPKRCKWPAADDATLVAELLLQKGLGNASDNAGWKGEVWTSCAKVLKGSEKVSGGAPKSGKACQTRWGALKAQYAIVKELRDKSGWGWDDEEKHIVVEDSIWDAFIKVKPNYKDWRYKSFPLYDDMAQIVDGAVATGAGSFQPASSASTTQPHPARTRVPLAPIAATQQRVGSPDWDIQPGDFPEPSQDENERDDDINKGPDESHTEREADGEPSSTQSQGLRKRFRAMSDSPSDKTKRVRTDGHGSGRKPSNGHAIMEMSNSLKDIAGALRIDFAGPSSPKRKTTAIQRVMKIAEFTQLEKIQIIQLIRSDTSIADSFLAIGEDVLDEDLQVAYLRMELQASST